MSTLPDMLAGFAVIIVIYAGYILSLALRFHRLRQELAFLQELKQEEKKER
mgnify:CR=1 FL=1